MENPDFLTIVRMLAIYLHVLALAIGAVAVAFGDFAIFARDRIDMNMLGKAASVATIALLVLWITGLAVIGMDTGFDTELLATKPKLLAKLSVVTVLTINSLGLHLIAFPRMATPQADPQQAALMPVIFGAISATSWLYAAFVGVSKPVAAMLGYAGYMGLFAGLTLASIGFAMLTVRPRLAARLERADASLGALSPG